MIDVTRALTEGRDGTFIAGKAGRFCYVPSGKEPKSIIPFSLDGLLLAPKPASGNIDRFFKPSAGAVQTMFDDINTGDRHDTKALPVRLADAFARAAATIWHNRGHAKDDYALSVDDTRSPITRWVEGKAIQSSAFIANDDKPGYAISAYIEDVKNVESSLLRGLLDSGYIKPYAEGCGAKTKADGQLPMGATGADCRLSLLGRLAAGSVIGSDSIHDCFGEQTDAWARSVAAGICSG